MTTLDDVAKRAGVSLMTVSRAINDRNVVSARTYEKVMNAINELNYRPNLLARGLATSKTKTAGVFVTNLENPLYSIIVSSITLKASMLGYDVILSSGIDISSSLKSVEALFSKQIDGLIVLPAQFSENDPFLVEHSYDLHTGIQHFYSDFTKITEQYREKGLPIVSVGDLQVEGASARVQDDYILGAKMGTEYLIRHNHKKIGFICHTIRDIGIWGQRYHGFFQAMKEGGLAVNLDYIVESDESIEGGFVAMEKLFALKDRPTAIYCANDKIALGALHAALKNGVRVPEDISIIGHDGSIYSQVSYPKLTTVSICPDQIGKKSMELLYKYMNIEKEPANETADETASQPVQEEIITPQIIEGQTVRQI